MTEQLAKKVGQAVKLLQQAGRIYGKMELCYSGGKDSDVILELAKMAGVEYEAIYKMTTLDPPYTIKHCRDNGVTVLKPRHGTMLQQIADRGFPSRATRWCCAEFKEYKTLYDTQILGIRKSESVKRAKLYQEPIMCRLYNKKERTNQVLPILSWNDDDVLEFINERQIKLHPVYYTSDGKIDIKKRLGCLCCPLRSDRGLAEFKQYPNFVKAWIRQEKKHWEKSRKKPLKVQEWFTDVYECFAARIFYPAARYACLNKESLFPQDWKKLLEDYFHIKL